MKIQTRDELWAVLRAAALVTGEAPEGEHLPPWYVRTMLGVAGWIGAFFLLGFVGIAFSFVMTSSVAAIMVGALCCASAGCLFRSARYNDFACQFGLAMSLVGQMMVAFGIFQGFDGNRALSFFLLFVFEAALAALLPNTISRVLTAWAAVAALSFGLHAMGFYPLATPLAAAAFATIWLHEERWAQHAQLLRPIGFGLALALLQLGSRLNQLLLMEAGWRTPPKAIFNLLPSLGTSLTALVFLWVVLHLLRSQQIGFGSRAALAVFLATAVLMTASFWATGLAVALLIIVLGFAGGNRPLVGLGLLGLAGFLSHYYYQLQETLLTKAIFLVITGALLLAARTAMLRYFPPPTDKEASHA